MKKKLKRAMLVILATVLWGSGESFGGENKIDLMGRPVEVRFVVYGQVEPSLIVL